MIYFSQKNKSINLYKKRIFGISFLYMPLVGDVLKIFFSKKGSFYYFEGYVSVYDANLFCCQTLL
jgi:hypothetical protein